MRKLALSISLLLLTNSAIADKVGDKYFVKDFYEISKSAISLRQNTTGANYSCGPTSLLFVKNYYWKRNFGTDSWEGKYVSSARSSLRRIYKDLGVRYNRTTSTGQLQDVAKKKWYWTSAKANGSNSINYNLSLMKKKFQSNQPVILALEGNYYRNPVDGYEHIVIFYKYIGGRTNKLYYFDPYYGRSHSIDVSQISSAIQGNLPYLRVVPWWNKK